MSPAGVRAGRFASIALHSPSGSDLRSVSRGALKEIITKLNAAAVRPLKDPRRRVRGSLISAKRFLREKTKRQNTGGARRLSFPVAKSRDVGWTLNGGQICAAQ
jgi:hypothetical protein